MSFSNRIRLPFKLHKPQFPEQAERYRKANGQTVTLSVVVRKVYEGLTDSLPQKLHERLKIALVHDHVEVEGDKYVGVVTQDGDYQIEWQDYIIHPLAQVKFKAEVTPFNATNSNCGTCEEIVQIVCVDDDAGTLAEDTTYVIDVLANDNICCNPVTISILTYDTAYLDSATINSNNEIVIHTKAALPDLPTVKILTYRAQCQNGQFDEADILAALDGSIPGCQPPTDLALVSVTADEAVISFTDAPGAAFYEWYLYTMPDNTFVIASQIPVTGQMDIGGLLPNQQYRVYIRTDCGGGNFSPSAPAFDFTTDALPPSEACGEYELFNNDDSFFRPGSYLDCTGQGRSVNIAPLHVR